MRIFAIRFERNSVLIREHSSVGLEHLPYKQRVGGSTPSAPTKNYEMPFQKSEEAFSFVYLCSECQKVSSRLRSMGST